MTAASDAALVLTALAGLATAGSVAFLAVLRELRAGRRATDAVADRVHGVARAQLEYQLQAVLIATVTTAKPAEDPPLLLPPAAPPAGPTPLSTPVEGSRQWQTKPRSPSSET